jgi:hypothetical protein
MSVSPGVTHHTARLNEIAQHSVSVWGTVHRSISCTGFRRQGSDGASQIPVMPERYTVIVPGRRDYGNPETHTTASATGRLLNQLFTGYLVAEAGEIKLLRQSFNPLAMARAQLPNGVPTSGQPA